MTIKTLRKRLLVVEVRRMGGSTPPPFFGISFEDGGPGQGTPHGAPATLEEYRARYGCEPPASPVLYITFDTPTAHQETRP